MTAIVQGMYDDEDFENDRLAIRLNYLSKDMTQGFNPVEISTYYTKPNSHLSRINNLFDSSIMFFDLWSY